MRPHWRDPESGDVYCESCAPADMEGDLNSNEVDSPEHCSVCGRPCEYSLTCDGVEYVLNAIAEEISTWPNGHRLCRPTDWSYYKGCRHIEIVRDWAVDLCGYPLEGSDFRLVDAFMDLTADNKGRPAPEPVTQSPPVEKFARRRRTIIDLDALDKPEDGVEVNRPSA